MNRLSIVALLLVITGIFIASNIYTFIPIYKNVALDLSITMQQAVWGSSVFSIFYACGLLTFGPVSEKVGRKKVLIIGLFISFLTTCIVGFSSNEISLYVTRGLQGFALGSFAPVAFAYTFDLFPIKQRTLVLALINTGFIIAGILGQLLSSVITKLFGWETVFYFFGISYLVFFICGVLLLPNISVKQKNGSSVFSTMFSLLKNRSLLKCYVVAFSILLTFVSFYDGVGRFLGGKVDEDILFIIRAIGLIGATLSFFSGKLVQKYGAKFTLIIGLYLTAGSLVLLLFSGSPIVIGILSIPFVAAISLLYPSVISLIGTIGEHARGSAISLYSFTLLTGASIGPIVASLLDFKVLLMCLIGLYIINLILIFRLNVEA
ncbi:MFS transporter [Fredinandcohnia sp. 179-A 10B2 NHS]|uniref:MFS transporter n=1 Tax=Fredinandcohnia sp. 179-A 10B2 NHS TaxID=3235176 RepID=UPI00399FEB37